MNRIALYTTIYPGMELFLADWCSSVQNQDYREFDIWVGVDGVPTETMSGLLGRSFTLRFVTAAGGDTPATLRCRALTMIAAEYHTLVLADSDDILEPTRVSAALDGLAHADINGCALGLIDRDGRDLGTYFGLNEEEDPCAMLPHNNFLGFSNTAWRTETLRRCLPAPDRCVALDWLLATRAWGHGARITFDRAIRMRYRQYGANVACVVPPFSAEQIIRATAVVTEHYRLVTADDSGVSAPHRHLLQDAAARIEKFRSMISTSPAILDAYITALNQLPPHRLWWLSVAHPELEDIWNC